LLARRKGHIVDVRHAQSTPSACVDLWFPPCPSKLFPPWPFSCPFLLFVFFLCFVFVCPTSAVSFPPKGLRNRQSKRNKNQCPQCTCASPRFTPPSCLCALHSSQNAAGTLTHRCRPVSQQGLFPYFSAVFSLPNDESNKRARSVCLSPVPPR
jgi:hypothetical protein